LIFFAVFEYLLKPPIDQFGVPLPYKKTLKFFVRWVKKEEGL